MGNTPGKKITGKQRKTLNSYFTDIVNTAPIDFQSVEPNDIYSAVCILLGRAATRITERGIFRISHLQQCGSVAENSTNWKYDRQTSEPFTEFDFLAVLNKSFSVTDDLLDTGRHCTCFGCQPLRKPPLDLDLLGRYHSNNKESLISNIYKCDTIYKLFCQELSSSLAAECCCLEVKSDMSFENPYRQTKIWFSPKGPGCDQCSVDMPTGTLHVYTGNGICREISAPENCSVMFLWTSKAETLSAPTNSSLTDTCNMPVKNLIISVDFLPALELRKRKTNEHECFLVPKPCNLACKSVGLRKSRCMHETDYMLNKMTVKHRRSYKIIKYLIHKLQSPWFINRYHIKINAIHHDRMCSNSSQDSAGCVLKMFSELQSAYENKELKCFDSVTNLLSCKDANHSEHYDALAKYYQEIIRILCAVSETDTQKIEVFTLGL